MIAGVATATTITHGAESTGADPTKGGLRQILDSNHLHVQLSIVIENLYTLFCLSIKTQCNTTT